MAREFWKSAGLHLVTRNAEGWLNVTPDYIRAYLTRPEVHPVEESNDHEIGLHEALLVDPFRPVSDAELMAIADPDAIDTYRLILAFRDALVKGGTIEKTYLDLIRAKSPPRLPPVFLDQMVHLILCNAMKDCRYPLQLRAAELFFRDQTVSIDEGRIMLADEEIVEMQAASGETGLAQLLAETGTPQKQVQLDVLNEDNEQLYWARSDRFDTVVDFRFEQPALDAFARVVEIWLKHLLRLDVKIEPRPKLEDADWRWHIGLDAEATRILNALYEQKPIGPDAMAQIIGLFRLRFEDERHLLERVRGKPVYMALAMTPAKHVKMKPQNLLTNLPLLQVM
jgi:Family of unknown function (DUF6352)